MKRDGNLVAAVLLSVTMLAIAVVTTGCAGWGDYAAEVRAVNVQVAADKKASDTRDQHESDGYLQAMQGAQSDVARVAMAGFWALTKARGGAPGSTPAYAVPAAPTDPLDSFTRFAGALAPTIAQVALGVVNANVSKRQSDNATATAVSTNSAFVSLGTAGVTGIRDVALGQTAVLPQLLPSNTYNFRDGVIGSGTFSPTTTMNTLTAGGDGVQGPGALTKPARVCAIDAKGVITCP